MHQPFFPFDDVDIDLSPDAEFALRHALRHARRRESSGRRLHGRLPATVNGHRMAALEFDDDGVVESFAHTPRQVA